MLPLTISKYIPCPLQAWAGCANDLQGPCERLSLPFGCLEGVVATLGCELRIQEGRGVTHGQSASWRDITHGLVDQRERCLRAMAILGGRRGLGRASLGQCNGTGPQGRILGRRWELEPAAGSFPATTWKLGL